MTDSRGKSATAERDPHRSRTDRSSPEFATISTVALPAQMPFNFPDEADALNFKGTGGDVGFGVHAVMYMRHTQRFGTHMWYHTGANGYTLKDIFIDCVGVNAIFAIKTDKARCTFEDFMQFEDAVVLDIELEELANARGVARLRNLEGFIYTRSLRLLRRMRRCGAYLPKA